jgi:SAM-dependent methyltransferase
VTDRVTRLDGDPSNGYEAAARQYIALRAASPVGVQVVLEWAQSLPRAASILDIGCGSGVPISAALMGAGYVVYGLDASPTLCTAFRENFPHAPIACESAETSAFFGRTFHGVVSWGLMFLLCPDAQRDLIERIAAVLEAGGSFLFTAPVQAASWADLLTARTSQSLGETTYRSILEAAGLGLTQQGTDQGENHYYRAIKPPRTGTGVKTLSGQP